MELVTDTFEDEPPNKNLDEENSFRKKAFKLAFQRDSEF